MAENEERARYTGLRDMFDGGGPGASGGPFKGGGLLSAVGNALTGNRGMGVGPEAGVGFAGYGYNDAGGNWVPASVDMRDGGGPGMAGPTFQGGGMYSGILNILGVRPMGYNDTMAAGGYNPVSAPRNPSIAPLSSPTPAAVPNNPRLDTPVGSMPVRTAPSVPAPSPMNTAANDPFIGLNRTLDPLMELAPVGPYISQAPFVSGDPVMTYPSSSIRRRLR